MIRTIISLDPDDKEWLDRKAREERTPMAQLVRRAIGRLRQEESKPSRFERLLRRTAGSQSFGDGLAVQRRLRREWGGARKIKRA
jgi:ribbon-helix-helix CopG family protein